jgi:type VI secretion system protein VasI
MLRSTRNLAAILILPCALSYADVPDKEIAECSAKNGDLDRLECFDAMSKRHSLNAPQSAPSGITGSTGKWAVSNTINPLDDSQTVTLALHSSSGESIWGDKVTMYMRCQSDTTNMYINWGDFLGTDSIQVTTRIGSNDSATSSWRISTSNQSTFKSKPIEFIKSMLGTSKFVAQTTPYGENPVTAIFDIAGLDNAIKPLRETCGWDIVKPTPVQARPPDNIEGMTRNEIVKEARQSCAALPGCYTKITDCLTAFSSDIPKFVSCAYR